MPIATLSEVLQPALKGSYAVGGLVTLGWEDMRAFVAAAEAENCSVILQAGPGCREHTPLPVLGKMFRYLADNASVPVVAHLDHGYTYDECALALDSGFTSLMYDGSRKSLKENIEETKRIVKIAHESNISCENETGVDAMAISVGNVHLQENKEGGLDEDRISKIQMLTSVPLVIHGGSGVPTEQRKCLARETNICKFNIGTELRMAFGKAMRNAVNKDVKRFDRVSILKETHDPTVAVVRRVLSNLKG